MCETKEVKNRVVQGFLIFVLLSTIQCSSRPSLHVSDFEGVTNKAPCNASQTRNYVSVSDTLVISKPENDAFDERDMTIRPAIDSNITEGTNGSENTVLWKLVRAIGFFAIIGTD